MTIYPHSHQLCVGYLPSTCLLRKEVHALNVELRLYILEVASHALHVAGQNVADMYKVAYYTKDDRLEEKINSVCKDGEYEVAQLAVDEECYTVIYKKVQ